MLVATELLAGSVYEEAVLVAAPLPQGGHAGFIVNRPTAMKLETLFPEHAPSRKVVDPIYLGGPVLSEAIVAVARTAPDGAGDVFHGAYVYSYLCHPGKSWHEHFDFARAASTYKIQRLGNEAGLPTLANIETVKQEFQIGRKKEFWD